MVWYFQLFKNFPLFSVIYTVKGFSIISESEVDVIVDDPRNVGNMICGSSAFSKPNLYIWKFLIHILLKSSLNDFEHKLTRI